MNANINRTLLALLVTTVLLPAAQTQADDNAAIKQTALDYIEGWYEGNAERMQRALHPDLPPCRNVSESSRWQNAIASTLQACAPQNLARRHKVDPQPIP